MVHGLNTTVEIIDKVERLANPLLLSTSSHTNGYADHTQIYDLMMSFSIHSVMLTEV